MVTYPVTQRLGFEGLHGQEISLLQHEGEGDPGRHSSHGLALLETVRLDPSTPVHRAVPIRSYGNDGLSLS